MYIHITFQKFDIYMLLDFIANINVTYIFVYIFVSNDTKRGDNPDIQTTQGFGI